MKSRTTAALLAFFLGAFGIHRFYLGQWFLGILYLIFCFTLISVIVAIVDCISFLLMSDDAFNMKYNGKYIAFQPQQPTVVIHNNNQMATPQTPAEPQQEQARNHDSKLDNTSSKIDPFQKEGDVKYADYDFDGAVKAYLKSLNVNSKNVEVHFKLACLYSLLEQKDSAFFHLSKAVEHGFYDFDTIRKHDHLAFLRTQSPDFERFVQNGYKLPQNLDSGSTPKDSLQLSDRIIEGIERLAKLRDDGLIDEEEFRNQKAKLLK